MQHLLRSAPRALRSRSLFLARPSPIVDSRSAHSSYGNDQSGHPQSEGKNPKSHLEHPGPEAPANQASKSSSKIQSGGSGSSGSGDKGRPAIHQPESAAEKDDPEVRKHNEDMKQRSEKSVNQLSEDDNKVDPNFWKGDVGNVKKDQS